MLDRDRRQAAIELAGQIANSFEDPGTHLKELLRKLRRLGVLAEVPYVVLWADWQQQGWELGGGPHLPWTKTDFDAAQLRFWRCRRKYEGGEVDTAKSWGDRTLLAHPVATLESLEADLSSRGATLTAEERSVLRQLQQVLSWIRDEVHAIASELQTAMLFGDTVQSVFERARTTVDAQLTRHAPDAVRELQAAYRALDPNTGPEELAKAACSCRRVLVDLADALYPPGPEAAHGMAVTQDKYCNRLRAWLRDHVPSETTRGLMKANLLGLDERIGALNKLAAKGDHSDLSYQTASMCLIHTYLIAADLLHFAGSDVVA